MFNLTESELELLERNQNKFALSATEVEWLQKLRTGLHELPLKDGSESSLLELKKPTRTLSAMEIFIHFRLPLYLQLIKGSVWNSAISAGVSSLSYEDIITTLEDDLSLQDLELSLSDTTTQTVEVKRDLEGVNLGFPVNYLSNFVENYAKKSNNPVMVERYCGLLHSISSSLQKAQQEQSQAKSKATASSGGSKWRDDTKVGQEELYEPMERVLEQLKAYREHSIPFLQRVNKKDAPDYYDVIKKPMDLGTIGKKMKNTEYTTKQEFIDDLNLIWENCLYYNINPNSIYRVHANEMKRKQDELAGLIPDDIVVRLKDEFALPGSTENEYASGPDVDYESDSALIPYDDDMMEKDVMQPSMEGTDDGQNNGNGAVESTTQVIPENFEFKILRSSQDNYVFSFELFLDSVKNQSNLKTTFSSAPLPMEVIDFMDPLMTNFYKEQWESKAETIVQRSESVKQKHAIIRTSEEMGVYYRTLDFLLNEGSLSSCESYVPEDSISSSFPDLVVSKRLANYSCETKVAGDFSLKVSERALEKFNYTKNMFDERSTSSLKKNQPCFDEYVVCYPDQHAVMRSKKTIETIWECKRLERKIYDAVVMLSSPSNEIQEQNNKAVTSTANIVNKSEPVFMDEDNVEDNVQLRLPYLERADKMSEKRIVISNSNHAQDILLRSLSICLLEQGFDSFHRSALDTFTEIVSDFIVTIGRLFKQFIEFYGKEFSMENVLRLVLVELGITELEQLSSKLINEPQKTLFKLEKNKSRLFSYYSMLMDDGEDEAKPVNEMDVDNNDDGDVAFVMGNFGFESTEDDYLGKLLMQTILIF